MACITVNGEVQSTFTIKNLEKAIYDILSSEEKQMIISPEGGIGYTSRKEYAERSFLKVIVKDPIKFQEAIDREIINSLHNYKPFSKYLSNG